MDARYICDAMLGGLAKRLRMLGWDVEYRAGIGDEELVRVALGGRTIVTRDRKLAVRSVVAGRCILLRSNATDEQLREVLPQLAGSPVPFSRCLLCNTVLSEVGRPQVTGRVPPFVLATQEQFRECPTCRKVYWRGTHVERAMKRLRESQGPVRS